MLNVFKRGQKSLFKMNYGNGFLSYLWYNQEKLTYKITFPMIKQRIIDNCVQSFQNIGHKAYDWSKNERITSKLKVVPYDVRLALVCLLSCPKG